MKCWHQFLTSVAVNMHFNRNRQTAKAIYILNSGIYIHTYTNYIKEEEVQQLLLDTEYWGRIPVKRSIWVYCTRFTCLEFSNKLLILAQTKMFRPWERTFWFLAECCFLGIKKINKLALTWKLSAGQTELGYELVCEQVVREEVIYKDGTPSLKISYVAVIVNWFLLLEIKIL